MQFSKMKLHYYAATLPLFSNFSNFLQIYNIFMSFFWAPVPSIFLRWYYIGEKLCRLFFFIGYFKVLLYILNILTFFVWYYSVFWSDVSLFLATFIVYFRAFFWKKRHSIDFFGPWNRVIFTEWLFSWPNMGMAAGVF